MFLSKRANAKINLSLDLTGVLPNGYHAIHTVMQSVSLCDTVSVDTSRSGISLRCDAPGVPVNEKNTAFRAAALFYEALGAAPAAVIEIEKRIPSQAGLGGGSADAAAALDILNELHGFPLDTQKLLETALKIGADVPFALLGGTRWCQNIGEITAELPHVPAHVLIAKPEAGVSTALAFQKFDAGAPLRHPDNDTLLYYFAKGAHKEALRHANNVFEQLLEIPEGEEIKRAMAEAGAYFTSLSGSGSAYYGLFDTAEAAERAREKLLTVVPFVACCETVQKGVQPA